MGCQTEVVDTEKGGRIGLDKCSRNDERRFIARELTRSVSACGPEIEAPTVKAVVCPCALGGSTVVVIL